MRKKVAIVGGGVSALVLACELDSKGFEVTIYEKNAALGRKFLVAGDGGLNLTHSENKTSFISRYTPSVFLEQAFSYFSNTDLINWINVLGIETYVGSSGRVFPKRGVKPIEVLNLILDKIKNNNVTVKTKHTWKGFSEKGDLIFQNTGTLIQTQNDLVIFTLGGASWPVTGSSGDWTAFFEEKQIKINAFEASNCEFGIDWPEELSKKLEGKTLKNTVISIGDKKQPGEVVLTRFGIEGSGIYPLSPEIRTCLEKETRAEILIDFKPALALETIIQKIERRPVNRNLTEHLKTELHLSDAHIILLKHFLTKEEYLTTSLLSLHIKQFKLTITKSGPIDDAISTVGGISLEEIDDSFQLKKLPGHFVIGEMLDYDAPTGGYLIQSCFSMAKFLADKLNSEYLTR